MSEIIHITDSTFPEQVAASELPVFVDFWAPWCGPCRMISPIIDELAWRLEAAADKFDGRAVIAKYNVDETNELASEHNILGIPTILCFKKGVVVARRTGLCDQATLDAWIEENL